MTSVSNNVVENYIQRVTELSQSGQRIPTSEELEKIATDLGVTEYEIQAAQKKAKEHFIRAQGYLRLKHWDDAINELQEAVSFNPSNLEMLTTLAIAYMGRWQQKPSRKDEYNIRAKLRQCLEIKADHEESLNLILKLDQARASRQQLRLALNLGLIATGISIFFLFNGLPNKLFSQGPKQSEGENLEQSLTQEIENIKQQQEKINLENIRQITELQQDNANNISRINQLEERLTNLEIELKVLRENQTNSQSDQNQKQGQN